MKNGICLVTVSKLRSHEAIDPNRLNRLVARIKEDGYLRNPIIADRNSLVVLDGHHRLEALKILGYKKIPTYLVDYQTSHVRVYLRRKKILMKLIKEAVIAKGSNGELFPNRTTCHFLQFRPRNINIRLEKLK